MENDQAFEAEAALEVVDSVEQQWQHNDIHKAPSSRVASQAGHNAHSTSSTSTEHEPLLGSREGSAAGNTSKWTGDLDYIGLAWWRKPSIYWLVFPFFIYALAFGGIIVPKLDLVLRLVCQEYYNRLAQQDPSLAFAPADPFGYDDRCTSADVTPLATRFTLALSLIAGILTLIVSPKLGALSDRYGRKRLLAITTGGGVLSEVVTIVVATHFETINYRWMLLGAFFEGITGSFIAGMAITHAYASDCTAPAKRAVAFGYFHAALFGGIALGPAISALVIKVTGEIVTIFYVALVAHLFFLSFLLLVVPESLTKKRRQIAEEKHKAEQEADKQHGPTLSRLQRLNVLAPLKILYPTGDGASPQLRWNLILLSAVDTIIFGTAMGAMTVVVYYSKQTFHWTPYDSNIFVTILNSTRVAALLIILPSIVYFFRTRPRNRVRRESGIELQEKQSGSDELDLNVIRLSVFLDMLGYVGYAFVGTGALFTASGMLAALGGMGSPTLQSALTKHVPHDRVGQLLGATGLLHALARIVAPIIFSLLFAATAKVYPQPSFVLLAGCFFLAFIFSFFVKPHVYFDEHEQAHVPSDDDSEATYT